MSPIIAWFAARSPRERETGYKECLSRTSTRKQTLGAVQATNRQGLQLAGRVAPLKPKLSNEKVLEDEQV